jgi:hypothetical protein
MFPFMGKKEDKKENENAVKDEKDEDESPVGKYPEACGVCGKAPTDKHWAGQYFHKKCFRKMKKMAKGMI